MDVVRTPEARFSHLPEFPFVPRYADVGGGLRMAYVDEGEKGNPPVIMLHGNPTYGFIFRKMIPPFVNGGLRVIVPDLIGFGRSDKPTAQADYTFAHHVQWLRALLVELDLRDITLVLHDWGSLLGLRLVADDGARFANIVVMNGFAPTPFQSPTIGFRLWRKFVQYSPYFPIGRIVAAGCTTKLARDVVRAYDAPFPSARYRTGPRSFPRLLPTHEGDPSVPDNRATWDAMGRWEKPLLTLFVENDPMVAHSDERLIAHVPGARGQPHERFPGGHFLQEDRGEELSASILRWLGSLKPS